MSLLFALAKTHNCLIYILLPISSPKKEAITRPKRTSPNNYAAAQAGQSAACLRAAEGRSRGSDGKTGKGQCTEKSEPVCVCVCGE